MSYTVEQTRRFARQYKKLHNNVATDVDDAVELLQTTHFLGADSTIANRQLDAAKNFMLWRTYQFSWLSASIKCA